MNRTNICKNIVQSIKDYITDQVNFDARVYVTTDWSNLNTEKFYVVTVGVYSTESEANANLTSVQSVCQEAYVKYSGNYMG